MDAIQNVVVEANATALVWLPWHCSIADVRFKGSIVTANRQKRGFIKCNCSPELSVTIFRSSQEVKKILLYKKNAEI